MTFGYQSEDFEDPYVVTVTIEPGHTGTYWEPAEPAEVIIDSVKIGKDYDIVDFISTELAVSIAEYALEIAAERSS